MLLSPLPGLSPNMRLGNQRESTSGRRQENKEREHEEGNTLRPADTTLPFNYRCRPHFSKSVEEREAFLIKEIDTCLKNHPRYFIEDPKEHFTERIYKLVNHCTGGIFHNLPEKCVALLHERKFLFEKRPEDKHYRNTGLGHRKIVVKFVKFIQMKTTPTGRCTLYDLENFCERGMKIGEIEVYGPRMAQKAPQSWSDSYSFFEGVSLGVAVRKVIDDHPEIFQIKKGIFAFYVGLQDEVYSIPSLWNGELLPKKSTKPCLDKSRVDVFLAKISSSNYGYKGKIVQAIIHEGPYKGRRIRIFDKFPADLSKIPQCLHVGTMVNVYAHFALGCNYEFNGIKVFPVASGEGDQNDSKRMEMVERGDSKASNLPLTSKQSPNLDLQYATLSDRIIVEKSLIKFVDEIFGGNLLSNEKIVGKLEKRHSSDYEHFFRNTDDVLEFIEKRPHLYYFHQGKSGVRKPENRKAYKQLFRILNDSEEGRPFNYISEWITAVDKDRLWVLLGSIDSLLTVTKDPRKRGANLYSLKMHFDKTEDVLLPGCPRIPPSAPDRLFFNSLNRRML